MLTAPPTTTPPPPAPAKIAAAGAIAAAIAGATSAHHPRPIAPRRHRISVVLCTFNGAAHLPAQLLSIARQYRAPDELIIFDDHSTDATVAIARSFADAAPFSVIIHENPTTLGSTRNFDAAIAAATGSIIAACDQDDLWHPEKLDAIEQAIEAGAGLVISDAHVVDDQLQPLGHRLWESIGFTRRHQQLFRSARALDVLLRSNVATGTAMAFSARHRDLIQPIDPGWIHDAWISLLIAAVDRCAALPQPLLSYRQHGAQQIGGRRLGPREKWAIARRMDQSYFERLADNYAAAAQRLHQRNAPDLFRNDANVARAIRRVEQKSLHCRARARMRKPGLAAPLLIAGEVCKLAYFRYSLGAASLAQDICA